MGDGRDGLSEAVHLAAEKRALAAEVTQLRAEVERLQINITALVKVINDLRGES